MALAEDGGSRGGGDGGQWQRAEGGGMESAVITYKNSIRRGRNVILRQK